MESPRLLNYEFLLIPLQKEEEKTRTLLRDEENALRKIVEDRYKKETQSCDKTKQQKEREKCTKDRSAVVLRLRIEKRKKKLVELSEQKVGAIWGAIESSMDAKRKSVKGGKKRSKKNKIDNDAIFFRGDVWGAVEQANPGIKEQGELTSNENHIKINDPGKEKVTDCVEIVEDSEASKPTKPKSRQIKTFADAVNTNVASRSNKLHKMTEKNKSNDRKIVPPSPDYQTDKNLKSENKMPRVQSADSIQVTSSLIVSAGKISALSNITLEKSPQSKGDSAKNAEKHTPKSAHSRAATSDSVLQTSKIHEESKNEIMKPVEMGKEPFHYGDARPIFVHSRKRLADPKKHKSSSSSDFSDGYLSEDVTQDVNMKLNLKVVEKNTVVVVSTHTTELTKSDLKMNTISNESNRPSAKVISVQAMEKISCDDIKHTTASGGLDSGATETNASQIREGHNSIKKISKVKKEEVSVYMLSVSPTRCDDVANYNYSSFTKIADIKSTDKITEGARDSPDNEIQNANQILKNHLSEEPQVDFDRDGFEVGAKGGLVDDKQQTNNECTGGKGEAGNMIETDIQSLVQRIESCLVHNMEGVGKSETYSTESTKLVEAKEETESTKDNKKQNKSKTLAFDKDNMTDANKGGKLPQPRGYAHHLVPFPPNPLNLPMPLFHRPEINGAALTAARDALMGPKQSITGSNLHPSLAALHQPSEIPVTNFQMAQGHKNVSEKQSRVDRFRDKVAMSESVLLSFPNDLNQNEVHPMQHPNTQSNLTRSVVNPFDFKFNGIMINPDMNVSPRARMGTSSASHTQIGDCQLKTTQSEPADSSHNANINLSATEHLKRILKVGGTQSDENFVKTLPNKLCPLPYVDHKASTVSVSHTPSPKMPAHAQPIGMPPRVSKVHPLTSKINKKHPTIPKITKVEPSIPKVNEDHKGGISMSNIRKNNITTTTQARSAKPISSVTHGTDTYDFPYHELLMHRKRWQQPPMNVQVYERIAPTCTPLVPSNLMFTKPNFPTVPFIETLPVHLPPPRHFEPPNTPPIRHPPPEVPFPEVEPTYFPSSTVEHELF